MTTEWRPEGWENSCFREGWEEKWNDSFDAESLEGGISAAYEAGADAIVKAIWRLAKDSPTKSFTFDLRKSTGPASQRR